MRVGLGLLLPCASPRNCTRHRVGPRGGVLGVVPSRSAEAAVGGPSCVVAPSVCAVSCATSSASRVRACVSVHVRHRACACGALTLHVHVHSQSVQLCSRSGWCEINAGPASSADGEVTAVGSRLRADLGLDLRGGELLPCLFLRSCWNRCVTAG